MSVTYSENTQTMRGRTISEATTMPTGVFIGEENLLDKIGAPWEIHIKSDARDSGSAWGTSTYGALGNTSTEPVPTINQADAEALGNDIHRVLKYYLQHRYIVSNIEDVRLNIALKYDDIGSGVFWGEPPFTAI